MGVYETLAEMQERDLEYLNRLADDNTFDPPVVIDYDSVKAGEIENETLDPRSAGEWY